MKCKICGMEMTDMGRIEYMRLEHNSNFKAEQLKYNQRIEVCPQCEFAACANNISQDEMQYLYSEGDDYTNYSSKSKEKESYVTRSQRAMVLFEALDMKFKSILDIGASTGYFLSLFKGRDIELNGIETSQGGCITARERYGIDLCKCYFEDFEKKSSKKYDLIVAMHVLEHISDLDGFAASLKKAGKRYVYIEVPCLSERTVGEPYGFFAEEHLNYFTPYSLECYMNKTGYKTIYMSIVSDGRMWEVLTARYFSAICLPDCTVMHVTA